MISIPHKTKQFLVLLVKLLIVGERFILSTTKLANNDQLDWEKFIALFRKNKSVGGILFILAFSVLNRYFEILKWQNLVRFLHPISVGESTKQVLAALTAGLFTPNGVGEYAGKALYFDKNQLKNHLFEPDLQWHPNAIEHRFWHFRFVVLQCYFRNHQTENRPVALWRSCINRIDCIFSKKINIKGYSIEKLIHKINEIPKAIHQKTYC